MVRLSTVLWWRLDGIEVELENGLGNDSIRRAERESIDAFVRSQRHYFRDGARVLDYGCGEGRFQQLVKDSGGQWVGFDRSTFPGTVTGRDTGPDKPLHTFDYWDVILCTQILQFVPTPLALLAEFRYALKPGGTLLLTYATNWDEIEAGDLHRFTSNGVRRLLENVGFAIHTHQRRAHVAVGGFKFPLGYAVVAHRPLG